LASERFDPREARRRFGQIAAFGTLGSLAGGLIAERVATLSSTPDLLILLAVLQVAASVALFRFAPSKGAEKAHDAPSFPEMISGAPYLVTLAAFVLLVSMSAATLDYLFNVRATAQFGKGPPLARFFAFFYSGTSVLTFLVQAGFSRTMLKRFGPGQTVSVLPIAVTGVGLITLFVPGAIMVIFSRGLEQLLRGSLYRTGYELFYTPMPAAERRSTKAAIDIQGRTFGGEAGNCTQITAPPQTSQSPTITSGRPQIAREAFMPAMVAASTQPAFKPVRTQSPTMNKLRKPAPPGSMRCRLVPTSETT